MYIRQRASEVVASAVRSEGRLRETFLRGNLSVDAIVTLVVNAPPSDGPVRAGPAMIHTTVAYSPPVFTSFSPSAQRTTFPQILQAPTMETRSRRPKGRDGVVSSLNVAIEAMNLAKELSSITPARAVFGSVGALLIMIRVCPILHNEMCQAHV